jgi:hypothetical protein
MGAVDGSPDKSEALPEGERLVVLGDMASHGETGGIGLLEELTDELPADTGSTEAGEESDLHDPDLVAGPIDDEPSRRVATDRDDGVGGSWVDGGEVASLRLELHSDEGVRVPL